MNYPNIDGTTAPDVGVYQDIAPDVYHGWGCASNSRLSLMIDRTPAHLKASIGVPDHQTPAKLLGQAIHCAIIEPDRFPTAYVIAERCEQLTGKNEPCKNNGTIWRSDFGWMCGTHAKGLGSDDGRTVIAPGDMAVCRGIRDSANRHPAIRELLKRASMFEASVVWDDPETGVRCKARWDGHIDDYSASGCDGIIFDVKSTGDAGRRSFARSIYEYGYHRQAAMYLDAAAVSSIPVAHYVVIPVEKEPPYAVGAYRLGTPDISIGNLEIRDALRTYARCLELNEWPAYSQQIEPISIPQYAFSQIEDRLRGFE